ncbi:hypothetical protein E0L93_15230 [Rubrobacter taiwanensis]|jgi:hypothetical protein|uniref:Uncharacterized protein n=1 Tax=Rubrobacter taiwanensis TaxID=185139 RepID=A0A4R1B8L3_9ACTN|nr:hypothetical protein [Rubrobacter taiwanensis]TCJ13055.1 hypothetical protein E0L93_15230 [Rubrobacter taiwanensis]
MMFRDDFMHEFARQYMAERQRFAEQCRMARRAKRRPSWRARAARRFFDMAFAVEPDEAWRAVWERMMRGEGARR